MTKLHITEYPNEITREQLDAAFAALGFDRNRCRSVTLDLEGFSASVVAEDLVGGFVGWVDIHVPVRPGRNP